LGATDEDLANFFDVAPSTIAEWVNAQPVFSESRKSGKDAADSNVADRLYQRATGYTHPEEKIFQYEGEPVRVETLKHYPPDTAAAIYWLNNRQRGRWSNRHLHELTGKDGGPIETRELSDEEVTKRLTDVRNRLVALTGAPSTNGRNGH
jgi:phage terminase Nu1 subunit (DNA packaging protein)